MIICFWIRMNWGLWLRYMYFYDHEVPIWFFFLSSSLSSTSYFCISYGDGSSTLNIAQLKTVDNYFIWIQSTHSAKPFAGSCLIDLYLVRTNELLTSNLHHVRRAHDFINLNFLNSWKSTFFPARSTISALMWEEKIEPSI